MKTAFNSTELYTSQEAIATMFRIQKAHPFKQVSLLFCFY